jgi:erythromycin esterase-like protein
MKRIIAFSAACIALLSLSTLSGMQGQSAKQATVDWLRTHAIRLQTTEARHGFADMQPLKKVIGNARIVSLGEATHGTREFFQLKHRMLEFLVTKMGFNIFSIEANMPEAYRLNEFVLTGKGDPAALLKGMYFWTWNTAEVLDMILWMRDFNKSGKGKVEFTGFDMQTPDVAMAIASDFITKYEPGYADSVRRVWDDAKAASASSQSGPSFGLAVGSFPIAAVAGKQVRFSGYIKTEGITRGYAGLWWRIDGASGLLKLDNMSERGPRGTTPWTLYEISMPVPADVKNINFGVLHPGDGTAWFDSLQVEIDDVRYANSELFDFDFESGTLKGLVASGAGYQVGLDKEVAHSGKQSLRSKYIGGPAPAQPQKQVDARQAVFACKEVLSHMESGRETWRKAGAADKDINWTIQNARIVLQYTLMKSGEQTRDQSMANNVKWILDHSPGAKIVLWAHNGHVASGGYSYETMGKFLRQTYGNQMVVFGFAFNQGSFQAMDMSRTAQGGTSGMSLRDFTVPPAPAESLDGMLATTGIPILAIDLGRVPQKGPVAEWLNSPHKTRSVGAGFSDANAASYLMDMKILENYDALLFIEKTTAARKNPSIPVK